MKFKLPRNIISNNILKNVLYLVSLALAVSYIINEQSLALISLILIACGVYIMNKNIVIALFASIIVTNLLLSMNYLKKYDIIEGLDEIPPLPPLPPLPPVPLTPVPLPKKSKINEESEDSIKENTKKNKIKYKEKN